MGKFVIRTVKTGVMFNLKAGNGEVIATSQVYKSLPSCKKALISCANPQLLMHAPREIPNRPPSINSETCLRNSCKAVLIQKHELI